MKRKKMSKLLMFVLASALMLVFLSVMASAATIDPATGIGTISATVGDSTVSFTVPYTMAATEGTDQVTILVVKGNNGAISYGTDTQPTNIVYIDQVGYSSTASSFTFVVDKPTATDTYWVKVGGTGIDTPASNSREIQISSNATVTVGDSDIPVISVVSSSSDVYGVSNAKVIAIDFSSLINTATDSTANYKVVVKGTELRYNPKNGKFVGTPLLGTAALAAADVVITKEARTVPDIIFGDLNNDSGVINTIDLSLMRNKNLSGSYALSNGDLSGDLNLDGVINTIDLSLMRNKNLNGSYLLPADQ